ncbi:MAG: MFS transporter [Proteobacteria bacterium]|nr:MFS transporter [Pseudomonadota bacterium]
MQATFDERPAARPAGTPRLYAWLIFGLSVGLLLSDYMSRQVLNALFPLLRAEWGLNDTQLGSLSGVVALTVGVLTFPLSLLADRIGRVRSVVVMALLWSAATMACGLAASYGQMLAARLFVGLGEAAYGSVGIAVVLAIFPRTMRSAIAGTFLAGGVFGSVFGVALGAGIAAALGWRWAFFTMAAMGIVLALVYLAVAREDRVRPQGPSDGARPDTALRRAGMRRLAAELFAVPSLLAAYVGSGLQFFVASAFIAWLPSFFYRVYGMPTAKAGSTAAMFILIGGVGMIVCGIVADRLGRKAITRKLTAATMYCLLTCGLFAAAFQLDPGPGQLVFMGLAMFFAAGAGGASSAIVANCTRASIHATALATLTLTNNLLGLAPGPLLTGWLADHTNLTTALQLVPLLGLGAAAAFWFGRRCYERDYQRVQELA